jgi:aerobic-type carbon monoxide dehydrogenase small subunit (CoxS/CutS family)
MTEKKPGVVTRRDFLKGVAVGAVAAAAVSAGVAAVSWPPAAPPGVVTKTETVTKTTTAAATTVTTTITPGPPPEEAVLTKSVTLNVNGKQYTVEVESRWSLARVLRDKLDLTGTKISCNRGECGGCTVLMDGKPVLSCMTLAIECEGKKITTIEALSDGVVFHPLQKAFIDHDGVQCGYCTPGMILTAKALLDKNPSPTEEQVKEAISGNICKCGAYPKIVESILAVSKGGS